MADTDILSAMAKVARLPLLFSLLKANKLYVAPGVFSELKHSLDIGRDYAQDIFALFSAGQIQMAYLTQDEIAFRDALPAILGTGERESIAIARHRRSAFLSNESRVAHLCKESGIVCFRLSDILRALWVETIVSKQEVHVIVNDLQVKDRMQFKSTTLDGVFADP